MSICKQGGNWDWYSITDHALEEHSLDTNFWGDESWRLAKKTFNEKGLSPRVSISTSKKTGFAPTYLIALQGATNDNGCVITSSFVLTPARIKEICRAEVPFTVAIANLLPTFFANFCSKVSTNSPTDDTKVESMH